MVDLRNMKSTWMKTEEELASKTKDFDELWNMSQQKDKDLEKMHKSKEMCTEEIGCMRDEINRMQVKLSCATRELETLRKTLEEKESLYTQVIEDREELRKRAEVAADEKTSIKKELMSLNEEIVSIRRRLSINEEESSNEDSFNTNDADIMAYDELIECIRSKISSLEKKLAEYLDANIKTIGELDDDKCNLLENVKEIQGICDRYLKQISQLTKEKEDQQAEIST